MTWSGVPARGPRARSSLLPPEVIVQEIVEDLQAALRKFAAIADALAPRQPPE
ncbi:hypothetical protein V6U90_07905 [Micromonospora sp. CPCC 206060]|uniref:hypothetical protein n=1 Tax=Micromonospora sp. CPCC 206060 TaxID=3122406 RepID=UPI002FF18688